jgi:hypothetical protein
MQLEIELWLVVTKIWEGLHNKYVSMYENNTLEELVLIFYFFGKSVFSSKID